MPIQKVWDSNQISCHLFQKKIIYIQPHKYIIIFIENREKTSLKLIKTYVLKKKKIYFSRHKLVFLSVGFPETLRFLQCNFSSSTRVSLSTYINISLEPVFTCFQIHSTTSQGKISYSRRLLFRFTSIS